MTATPGAPDRALALALVRFALAVSMLPVAAAFLTLVLAGAPPQVWVIPATVLPVQAAIMVILTRGMPRNRDRRAGG